MAKTSRKRIFRYTRNKLSKNNTGQLVLSAIKKLTKNTAWTARTIVKFIKMEYSLKGPNISRKVTRALKRGVKLGILQREHGRYRLNAMSRLACPEVELERGRYQAGILHLEQPLRLRSRTPSRTHTLMKYDRKTKILEQSKPVHHGT
ncbi:uncharacterized protein LOC113236995 [Hyposmocoma kahamanoa]|uniref:uncharacterized protein LOC113236995 n=1 Tax=Hyposmocoma kahamanoa TaxID=1477025 RepID=UPI000E6D7682|nr:uncharacterized protein LOC113236995 [Hyposmocoma kahamanoa]